MNIVPFVVVLIVIGVGLMLVNRIAMDSNIKLIINVVVIAATVLWVLDLFHVPMMRIGGR